MRLIPEITADQENFRAEPQDGLPGVSFIRRDPVEPVPVGTLLLVPMRVVGYDPDCDGSLMARLQTLDLDEVDSLTEIPDEYRLPLNEARRYSGLHTHWGLYPSTGLVVTSEEIAAMRDEAV